MAISMQASAVGMDNYIHPVSAGPASYNFYETVYQKTGKQEWIIMPGLGCGGISASVTLSFPLGGSAFIEATTSPASVVSGTFSPSYSPVVYPICDAVQDTTNLTIQGPTAIRVNVVGGTPMISVRV